MENAGSLSTTPSSSKTVAIIGAGLSGVVSAVHLLRAGMDITVFERADNVGGTWIYSPQPDRDPPFPNMRPLTPVWDELEVLQERGLGPEVAIHAFAPPGPVYTNMKSRGSETIMRTSLKKWPDVIRAPIKPCDVVAYLRDIAKTHCVEKHICFRTRVEAVRKNEGDEKWRVHTSRLLTTPTSYTQEREAQEFDAVVVATGRYSAPRVPDVPGLAQWKAWFPGRITHSKQYRSPAPYRGQTVLVIGAFISAMEITNELVHSDAKVYESANHTRVDFRDRINHERAEKVAMVAEFKAIADNADTVSPQLHSIDDGCPIPARVVLRDGRILDGIHHVIIATGYLTTFPFLGPVLEQPHMALQDADETVIVTTDARTVHNLHEDIFYIPDSTLGFIGVTQFASTFSLYDLQAQILAAVWAGRVRLPPQAAMKDVQRRRKNMLLPGTLLNSIFLLDHFVIRRLLHWVNKDLADGGFDTLSGPDDEWWLAFRAESQGARSFLQPLQDNYLRTYGRNWEDL